MRARLSFPSVLGRAPRIGLRARRAGRSLSVIRESTVVRCSVALLALCAATGCSHSTSLPEAGDDASLPPTDSAAPIDDRFREELLAIAAEYVTWERVDADPRHAIFDCRAPSTYVGLPRISASEDADTHGQKLYYLYARDKKAYLAVGNAEQTGQAVVKQSWQALVVEGTPGAEDSAHVVTIDGQLSFAAADEGRLWVPGAQGPLFVLFQPAGAPPGATDEGWVYGTVTPDGKTVTSCGLVHSCMRCHGDAPYGRLYGLDGG